MRRAVRRRRAPARRRRAAARRWPGRRERAHRRNASVALASCTSGRTTAGASRSPEPQLPDRRSTGCCASGWSPRAASARGRVGRRGSGWQRCTTRSCWSGSAPGPERARAARARTAVVAGARRARPPLGGGTISASRLRWRAARHEPRRRHAPRGPRLRARLLPVQRRRGRAVAAAGRGRGAAGAGRRLRRPPGRRHGRPARAGPGHVHAVAARRAQLPVPAHPVRPRRRPAERQRRRRATCRR